MLLAIVVLGSVARDRVLPDPAAGSYSPTPSRDVGSGTLPHPTGTTPGASVPGTAAPGPALTDAPDRLRRLAVCQDPATLTLRRQLAQLLMLGVDGSSDRAVLRLAGGRTPVGGIFVYGTSTRVFRSGVLRRVGTRPLPPLVAVDDEGGRVQRLDDVFGQLPSARRQGAMDPLALRRLAATRGRRLASVGVTMNLAPVVDLGGQRRTEVIGDRAYAPSAEEVVTAAGAVAAGLRDAGVLPTLKHFPGHGRARGDSHRGATRTPTLATLRAADLLPYRILPERGTTAVMVGHLEVPGLSSRDAAGRRIPASLDPAAYRLLRTDYGFTGLVITDELGGMHAVSDRFGVRAAVARALRAGADLALVNDPGSVDELLDYLERAVETGRLPRSRVRESVERVLWAKGCPLTGDRTTEDRVPGNQVTVDQVR